MTMTFDDFEKVFRATVQEPIPSIFLNRSIDWQDHRFNEMRSIVDLTILIVSTFLNVCLFVAILSKRKLYNSVSCYVISLTISNFVVLLNVLDDVLKYWFDIEFEPDLDFIGRVSLHSSSLTLVTFTLDRFIAFCRIDSEWHAIAAKTTTAVKAILVIWSYASIASALELNLYEHFRTRTVINIFCWSTAMYVLLPTLIILGLDFILALELLEYREVVTIKWSPRDLESLRLLISLTVGFYVTMVPQRIATILFYKEPQICCSPMTMNICYYLVKVSTITIPIICIVVLKNLRNALLEIVFCRR